MGLQGREGDSRGLLDQFLTSPYAKKQACRRCCFWDHCAGHDEKWRPVDSGRAGGTRPSWGRLLHRRCKVAHRPPRGRGGTARSRLRDVPPLAVVEAAANRPRVRKQRTGAAWSRRHGPAPPPRRHRHHPPLSTPAAAAAAWGKSPPAARRGNGHRHRRPLRRWPPAAAPAPWPSPAPPHPPPPPPPPRPPRRAPAAPAVASERRAAGTATVRPCDGCSGAAPSSPHGSGEGGEAPQLSRRIRPPPAAA